MMGGFTEEPKSVPHRHNLPPPPACLPMRRASSCSHGSHSSHGSHGSHGSLAASTSALRAQEKSSPDGRPSAPLTDGQVTGVYLIGTIKHSINTKKSSLYFLVII